MGAIDELLCRRRADGLELALVQGGRLVAFDVSPDRPEDPAEEGAVLLGRIERHAPELEAAFVGIGGARPGFLRFADMPGDAAARPDGARPGGPRPGAGRMVMVQVVRRARGDKAPRLTMKIELPGRFLALRPCETGLEMPPALDEAARERLAALLGEAAAEAGIRLRPAAAGADEARLTAELHRLRAQWAALRERAERTPPSVAVVMAAPDPLHRALREHGGGLRRIMVEDRLTARRLSALLEAWGDDVPVEVVAGELPIFETHDIAGQIEAALAAELPLPSGGRLLFEPGRTLTAIDVDSGTGGAGAAPGGAVPAGTLAGGAAAGATGGGRTAAGTGGAGRLLAVNLEAAEVIARQLRLRNIGGLIVIDFITLRAAADRRRVLERLAAALADDPAAPQVMGWTRAGLVEVTRARAGRPLAAHFASSMPERR